MRNIFLLTILSFFCLNSFALEPEARLKNEKQEARALSMFSQIRCLVCEAQSIEGSNTEFSAGMRKVIRKKISKGKSDAEIKSELKNEFGEQILMSVEASSYGILPWILPFVFAFGLGFFVFRRKA